MPEISDEELKALQEKASGYDSLATSKQRVEEEMSKYKTRAQKAEADLDEVQKEALKKDGDVQGLLQKANEENQKLKADIQKRDEEKQNDLKDIMTERLRNEVAVHAKDAHDIDMVLKVSKHKDKLKIDYENKTIGGVEEFLGAVRNDFGYLFGKKMMPFDNKGKPPGGQDDDPNPSDQRTDEEKFRDELKTVKSRAEQKKVYEKYGKPMDSFMMNG